MGGIASLHFFTEEADTFAKWLSKRWEGDSSSQKSTDLMQAKVLDMINAAIAKTEDRAERQEKEKMLKLALQQLDSISSRESTAIIAYKNAASLMSEDIRVENIEKAAKNYSKEYDLPVMGFGLYDGNNMVVVAAKQGKIEARGFYWFDENDIQPIDVQAFRETLLLPCTEQELCAVFAKEDGEEMAAALEEAMGLLLLIWPDECDSMPQLTCIHAGQGAKVYHFK